MSCSKILLDSVQSAAVSWAWRWTEQPVQGGQRRVEDRTGQRWLSALTSCCLPFYPSLWLGFIFMTCTNFCILGLCHCTHLCLTLKSQPQRKRWNGLGWSANSRTLRTAKMSWNQWWQSHNLANPQDPLSSTLWKMNFTGFYEFMWIPSQKNASKMSQEDGHLAHHLPFINSKSHRGPCAEARLVGAKTVLLEWSPLVTGDPVSPYA